MIAALALTILGCYKKKPTPEVIKNYPFMNVKPPAYNAGRYDRFYDVALVPPTEGLPEDALAPAPDEIPDYALAPAPDEIQERPKNPPDVTEEVGFIPPN